MNTAAWLLFCSFFLTTSSTSCETGDDCYWPEVCSDSGTCILDASANGVWYNPGAPVLGQNLQPQRDPLAPDVTATITEEDGTLTGSWSNGRRTFSGSQAEDRIFVNFPDDRAYAGTLVDACRIQWDTQDNFWFRDCNDNDACTVDSCDTGKGCSHIPIECDSGICNKDQGCDTHSDRAPASANLAARRIDPANPTETGITSSFRHQHSIAMGVSGAGVGVAVFGVLAGWLVAMYFRHNPKAISPLTPTTATPAVVVCHGPAGATALPAIIVTCSNASPYF